MLFDFVYTAMAERVEAAATDGTKDEPVNRRELQDWLVKTFPIGFVEKDLEWEGKWDSDAMARRLVERVDVAYRLKEKVEDPAALRWLERQIMLTAVDGSYREHLYGMDGLRQGVQLRAYGQRDPLVEYKQEAYEMFAELMENIKEQILSNMFRSATTLSAFRQLLISLPREEVHAQLGQFEGTAAAAPGREGEEALPVTITIRRQGPKVGRNDPCPCGSGKKFKHCCAR
jgi:preprotein translocase subunit SecA